MSKATRVYRIHPAIGIARLGNADRSTSDGWFIGPETPDVPANYDLAQQQFLPFKHNGRIKAQAARFRVWEYRKKNGRLTRPREITFKKGEAEIDWRVTLANRKAWFFNFRGMGGERDAFAERGRNARQPRKGAEELRNGTVGRRRAGLHDETRSQELILGPRMRRISGTLQGPREFDIQRSPQFPIETLGQLRTDSEGRLLILGGYGVSAPMQVGTNTLHDYTNNDGWFDDVSDGPVTATLRLKGRKPIEVEPSWVIVAPPDFSPALRGMVTLYDLLLDLAVRTRRLKGGPDDLQRMQKRWNNRSGSLGGFRPSFVDHVFPILHRAVKLAWVHAPLQPTLGALGVSLAHAALERDRWPRLAEESESARPAREAIFRSLRDPRASDIAPSAMPQAFGDDYNDDNRPTSAAYYLSLTQVQYAILRQWVAGKFKPDWTGDPPTPAVAKIKPDELDRAALEPCIGGAFYPGLEVSWLMRNPSLYRTPFRIIHKTRFAHGSPFNRFRSLPAGFFTQQLALPWQADMYACMRELDWASGRIFAWWPAHRPDDVYPENGQHAVAWDRGIDLTPPDMYHYLLGQWATRGFVVRRGDRYVETEGPPLDA